MTFAKAAAVARLPAAPWEARTVRVTDRNEHVLFSYTVETAARAVELKGKLADLLFTAGYTVPVVSEPTHTVVRHPSLENIRHVRIVEGAVS